ncbi:hypothetical protein D3C72_1623640 [compost metagenome]
MKYAMVLEGTPGNSRSTRSPVPPQRRARSTRPVGLAMKVGAIFWRLPVSTSCQAPMRLSASRVMVLSTHQRGVSQFTKRTSSSKFQGRVTVPPPTAALTSVLRLPKAPSWKRWRMTAGSRSQKPAG